MPTVTNIRDMYDVPSKDIHLRFAFRPVNDVHGKRIWLDMYWVYVGECELGVYALRGRIKDYKTKYEFWKNISYGVNALRSA